MANLLPLLWMSALLPAISRAATIIPQRLEARQSGSDVDTDAGASGGSGGGSYVSQGGVIAIIVIVVIVVVLGVASTVLFVLAKRRQWDVRASIKRASRRFTGRGGGAARQPAATDRQSKRVGLQMSDMPARGGQSKRGMGVAVNDVEKGSDNSSQKNLVHSKKPEGSWMWRNDWKR